MTCFSKLLKEACFAAGLLCFTLACTTRSTSPSDAITASSRLAQSYLADLDGCIAQLDTLSRAVSSGDRSRLFGRARHFFKRAEPVLAFVDASNYKSLNGPNILKVDEEDKTSVKIREPFGFQVMEEQLAADSFPAAAFDQNVMLTRSRLQMIRDNASLALKPHHILLLVRESIVRVALTGITGFDSPVLGESLELSRIVYDRMGEILETYAFLFGDDALGQAWQHELAGAREALTGDFDRFDRFAFIRDHTHNQMALWVRTAEDWEVDIPYVLALHSDAVNLFSASTFNPDFFGDQVAEYAFSPEKAALGKVLFRDNRLSASKSMSCATCHQENRAFTDGLMRFPGQVRNTPTLLYAALQQGFFYDNREGSIEGQIVGVIHHEEEFATDLAAFRDAVLSDSAYARQFAALYRGRIDDYAIRNALAHYIRSLAPFASRFDRAIRAEPVELTESEVNGFNLFMGKAKCATCHFPPVFNGTVPPSFLESEVESIGVPASLTGSIVIDPDPGRYNVFGTRERRHFFKTPTVRNISRTAPYMHNGVYPDLFSLMDFYNHGGGSGLGIAPDGQTLPPDSLHLTASEITDIIAFMNSLEDQY